MYILMYIYYILMYIYIYVKSRKMVLMNLFAEQGWTCRCREWTWGHRPGREGVTN